MRLPIYATPRHRFRCHNALASRARYLLMHSASPALAPPASPDPTTHEQPAMPPPPHRRQRPSSQFPPPEPLLLSPLPPPPSRDLGVPPAALPSGPPLPPCAREHRRSRSRKSARTTARTQALARELREGRTAQCNTLRMVPLATMEARKSLLRSECNIQKQCFAEDRIIGS
eukprot:4569927-Pleurochrysis_carterae.AAC.1